MIEKQSLSDQRIIDCLNTDYGIKVATLTFIPLGADMDASVYKAQTHDQSSYFVKIKHGHYHDIGPIIQLLLHNAGIQQIISPIKTNHGQPTRYIDDFTLIVYPFIEGKDGFSQNLTDEQWITFGKALRQIHQLKLPASAAHPIQQENFSPKWRNKVRSIFEHDQHAIPSDEIASKFLASLKKHKSIILRLVDKAEKLALVIQKQPVDFVLCHSDIHGGNVLIADDGTLYIVDWDQPIMAPKERDLMFIGGGVGNVWNNKRDIELFYIGYGKTEINKKIIDYYRCERIIQDVAEYYQQLLLATDGGKNREVMYKQFIDMFKPGGVVDIAFKTDTDL